MIDWKLIGAFIGLVFTGWLCAIIGLFLSAIGGWYLIAIGVTLILLGQSIYYLNKKKMSESVEFLSLASGKPIKQVNNNVMIAETGMYSCILVAAIGAIVVGFPNAGSIAALVAALVLFLVKMMMR